MLVKVVRRISYPFIGYLSLLLAFALLGLFVAALAYRSGWAAVAGVALGGSLFAAVVGFRKGAAKLAQSRREGDPGHNVSVFSEPLRREQVDQYYVNYRADRRAALTKWGPTRFGLGRKRRNFVVHPHRVPAAGRAVALGESQDRHVPQLAATGCPRNILADFGFRTINSGPAHR
jgi:hypothetical protein